MSTLASVRVTVTVAVDPGTAFAVFTDDFHLWYSTGSVALGHAHHRSAQMLMEPGPQGRIVECRPGRAPIERARVTHWAPGERLVFVDNTGTEVEVVFTEVAEGTRVVLEHRGLDRLPPGRADEIAKYGWRRLADWFEQHLREGTTT